MTNCHSVTTPLVDLNRSDQPIDPNVPIRELIGSLIYLAHTSRPDILFAVNFLARNMAKPVAQDWSNAKRILRYLKGTPDFGYEISASSLSLKAISDADYGGDTATSKSTSGLLILAGDTPIYWKSKTQHTVAQSTAEAELYAITAVVKDLIGIVDLLKELQIPIKSPIPVYTDNQAAIAITNSATQTRAVKHIRIRRHFIQDEIEHNRIIIKSITSEENTADLFTKSLPRPRFEQLRSSLVRSQAPLQGGR